MLTDWGVNRFSVSWAGEHARPPARVPGGLRLRGEPLRGARSGVVPARRVLLPTSITTDFNFPAWHYFGRGAGEQHRYHRYRVDSLAPATTDVA